MAEIRRSSGAASVPMTARSAASGAGAMQSARSCGRSGAASAPMVQRNGRGGVGLAFRPAGRASQGSGSGNSAGMRPADLPGRVASPSAAAPLGLAATPCGKWPNVQADVSPFSGQHSPNFQRFRKKEDDPSIAMEKKIRRALASSDMGELQEVYRGLCAKDGQRFVVESRLVTKVVQKMQKLALAGLQERIQSGDVEECRAFLQKIDDEPMLSVLMKSQEASHARLVLHLTEVVAATQEATSTKEGKRELPIQVQEDYLDVLRDAIRAAQRGGLESSLLQAATCIEQNLAGKLQALAALRSAVGTQDLEQIESAMREAQERGVSAAELRVHRDALADVKLEHLMKSMQTENLRSFLKEIQKNGGMSIDDARIQNGWRTVHHEDLIEAMRTNDPKKLRLAIAYAQAAGLTGEMARTLTCAEKRIADLEAKEAKGAVVLQRLQSAVYKRDIDSIRAALAEAGKKGVTSPLVNRAEVVLCEEELRTAIGVRIVSKIKAKVTEGIELGIDTTIIDCGMHILEVEDPKAAAWARIREAIHRGDTDGLRRAIESGRSAGVDETELDDARSKLDEILPPLKLHDDDDPGPYSMSQPGPDEEASPFGEKPSETEEAEADKEDALRELDAELEEEEEEEDEADYDDEEAAPEDLEAVLDEECF